MSNSVDFNEKVVAFDVDETLVEKVYGIDTSNSGDIELNYYGEIGRYKILQRNVEQIRSHLSRGWSVYVWSHSGPVWANHVLEALGFSDPNIKVQNKPLKYFDDLPAGEWMGERIFLKN